MNPAEIVLRWYRHSTGGDRPERPEQFTAEEVLRLLRPETLDAARPAAPSDDRAPAEDRDGPRAEAVRDVAAYPTAWLDRVSRRDRFELGQLAERLPALVFHHARGGNPDELVEQFGGWSIWRYERALEVAAGCIACHLNQERRAA